METKNNPNILTFRIGIIAATVYIVTMGIGMYLMHNVFGGTYGDVSMLSTLVWVEVVLSLICIYFVRKYTNWKAVGFGKTQWKQALWLLPIAILMVALWPSIFGSLSNGSLDVIGLIAITTLMVGFSEELMFRGILLRGALSQKGIYASMLISAVGFSLLHAVNVFGGVPFHEVPIQLLLTFLWGLFFAAVALKLRNLAPLMVLHWLWDFSNISAGYLSTSQILAAALPVIEIVLIIILFILMQKETPETVKIST